MGTQARGITMVKEGQGGETGAPFMGCQDLVLASGLDETRCVPAVGLLLYVRAEFSTINCKRRLSGINDINRDSRQWQEIERSRLWPGTKVLPTHWLCQQ